MLVEKGICGRTDDNTSDVTSVVLKGVLERMYVREDVREGGEECVGGGILEKALCECVYEGISTFEFGVHGVGGVEQRQFFLVSVPYEAAAEGNLSRR